MTLNKIAVFLVVFLILVTPIKAAINMQPGVLYEGGTRLQLTGSGVSFTIPAGYRGALPQGSKYFIIEPLAGGATLFATGDYGSAAELRTVLNAPINIGAGIILEPMGEIKLKSGAFTGDYRVLGSPQPYNGRIVARAGTNGIAIVFGLIAPAEQIEQHNAALFELLNGTQFKSTAGNSGGQQPGNDDSWGEYLRGNHLVRYYTNTGYTEETHLWFCSNGTFHRTGASGGFGGGGSGASQNSSSGVWRANGTGANGTLVLTYGNGGIVQHLLFWDFAKKKLFLDNKRWLSVKNDVCR